MIKAFVNQLYDNLGPLSAAWCFADMTSREKQARARVYYTLREVAIQAIIACYLACNVPVIPSFGCRLIRLPAFGQSQNSPS